VSFLIFLLRTIIVSSESFEKEISTVLFDSVGTTFMLMITLMLATPAGYNLAKRLLIDDKGLIISSFCSVIPFIFTIIGIELGLEQFTQFYELLSRLPFEGLPYWLNGIFVVFGLFIGLKTCFMFSLLRENRSSLLGILKSNSEDPNIRRFKVHFILCLISSPIMLLVLDLGWLSLLAPLGIFMLFSISKIGLFNRNTEGFSIGDLVVAALPAGILIVYQPSLAWLWTLTVPISGVVIMVSTGFGREYFHYSYVPRSSKEVKEVLFLMLFSLVLFIPLAHVVGFIDATEAFGKIVPWETWVQYIGTWVYLVGISEEFIFRCGLLILVKDSLIYWDSTKNFQGIIGKIAKKPYFTAMIIAAIIFGLAHISKGIPYAFLAIVAGILYGIPFVKYKTLFGPIMLHAFVDVIAVAYFAAPL
jgi:membrane protease YdiL (CAAX protease family)